MPAGRLPRAARERTANPPAGTALAPYSGVPRRTAVQFRASAIYYHRAMPSTRRFPPPWSIEESAACYIVRDGDKQALAYVYFENEPGRRSSAKLLTRDEAFLIAVNIAKLPRVPRQILKDIPRPPNSASRDD
jgi:hypothetical protein